MKFTIILLLFSAFSLSSGDGLECFYHLEMAQEMMFSLQDSMISADLFEVLLILESLPEMVQSLDEACGDFPSNKLLLAEFDSIQNCPESLSYIAATIDEFYFDKSSINLVGRLASFAKKFAQTCLSYDLDASTDADEDININMSTITIDGNEVPGPTDLSIYDQLNALLKAFLQNMEVKIDYKTWLQNEDIVRVVIEDLKEYVPELSKLYVDDALDIKEDQSNYDYVIYIEDLEELKGNDVEVIAQ